jgi:DNA-binding HxlR family transcriptional regulator
MTVDKMRDCPVSYTIGAVQGKWVPRILWHLRQGPSTFGNICRATEAQEAVLARNLRAMTNAGLIERMPKQRGEVQMVEYSYSELGRSLIPVLDALGEWGLRHMEEGDTVAVSKTGDNR